MDINRLVGETQSAKLLLHNTFILQAQNWKAKPAGLVPPVLLLAPILQEICYIILQH
jgi:hypothetical protein